MNFQWFAKRSQDASSVRMIVCKGFDLNSTNSLPLYNDIIRVPNTHYRENAGTKQETPLRPIV